MRKNLKKLSMVLVPMFMFGFLVSCTPTQTHTAKNVVQQVEFYVDMAESLIVIAKAKYPDNPKVVVSLEATMAALATTKAALRTAVSGLDKDMEAVRAAVVVLVVEVFALAQAIKEAASK